MIVAGGVLLTAAIVGAAVVAERRPVDSDYFGPNMPTWVRVPTTIGDPVYVGVLVLDARPGDTLELESLSVENVAGDATVEPMLRILEGETRILGGIAASDVPETIDLSAYVPLPGVRFADADGPVELAVRVEGTSPLHGFDGMRLRFMVNGSERLTEDRIPMRASICAGATRAEAVERCRPIEQEMHSLQP